MSRYIYEKGIGSDGRFWIAISRDGGPFIRGDGPTEDGALMSYQIRLQALKGEK